MKAFMSSFLFGTNDGIEPTHSLYLSQSLDICTQ